MIDMSPAECHELLDHSLIGRLGLVGPDGRPYTIPVRYVWHQGAVYLRIAYDGRKQEAIEFGRHVCFETDALEKDFSHYASVVIEGLLVDIHEDAEKRAALVAMNDKYARLSGLPTPGPNPVIQGVAIRKISVEKLSGRKHDNEPAPSAGRMMRRPLELTTALRRNRG